MNSIYILDFLNHFDWVGIAKVVLSLIMLALSAVCLMIMVNFRRWHQQLEHLEIAATQQSDQAMMEFIAVRARLSLIKSRLFRKTDEPLSTSELLKQGGKILLMALSQERNLWQWGLLGLKVARSAWTYWKNK